MIKTLFGIWKQKLKDKKFKIEFILTLIFLLLALFLFTRYLTFNEGRNGVTLDDPFLALFKPVNTNWLTFGLIYGSIFIAIISFLKTPDRLMFAFQSYMILLVIRSIAMYSIPLNPPHQTIPLIDPFVKYLGTGIQLNKDLFFSGHTATLFLLYLISENKILKKIFLICTIAVGLSVLIQHTHYSVDVIAAPFFGYGVYKIIFGLRKKFKLS